jgi:hypothetical protein
LILLDAETIPKRVRDLRFTSMAFLLLWNPQFFSVDYSVSPLFQRSLYTVLNFNPIDYNLN